MSIHDILSAQHAYFASGATLPLSARKAALSALLQEVDRREKDLISALSADLGKSAFESYMTEVGLAKEELRFHLKHLGRWARDRKVSTPLTHFPARSIIRREPYGVALILSPWNYPLQLALEPLTGALSAGNCAILKPSAYAPSCSQILHELVSAALPSELAAVVQGGREENQALLEEHFDYIFFTGGVEVGRLVMEKAARHLTPVTLELGGKSPCIVDSTADIKLAARRIAFGKLLNAGQTCVAPDYILVHRSVRTPLIQQLQAEFNTFLGPAPLENPDYPCIINDKHLTRLRTMLAGCQVLWGGTSQGRRIAPALVDGDVPSCPAMAEEIFGPVLPILAWDTKEDVLRFVSSRPKPLALYLFTRDKSMEETVLSRLSFGGGCVNDTIMHLATPHLPFGGAGGSGMGQYHGKESFDTFSRPKSILKKGAWPDLPVRYHPYTASKERLLRFLLK